MKRLELAQLIRYRTRTDDTTFPDEEMLVYVNIYLLELAEAINEVDEGYFGIPTFRDLVEDQVVYTLPTDVLNKIDSVEVKFSSDGDYIPLFPIDRNRLPEGSTIDAYRPYFNNTKGYAAYEIYGNALYLYCGDIEDIEDGIKLNYFAEPTPLPDLTDNTTDISIDPSDTGFGLPKPFHELLARRVGIEYKSNAEKPIPLTDLEQKYEFDLEKKLSRLVPRNKSRSVIPRIPLVDGYNSEAHLPFALQSGTGNMFDGSDL